MTIRRHPNLLAIADQGHAAARDAETSSVLDLRAALEAMTGGPVRPPLSVVREVGE